MTGNDRGAEPNGLAERSAASPSDAEGVLAAPYMQVTSNLDDVIEIQCLTPWFSQSLQQAENLVLPRRFAGGKRI